MGGLYRQNRLNLNMSYSIRLKAKLGKEMPFKDKGVISPFAWYPFFFCPSHWRLIGVEFSAFPKKGFIQNL